MGERKIIPLFPGAELPQPAELYRIEIAVATNGDLSPRGVFPPLDNPREVTERDLLIVGLTHRLREEVFQAEMIAEGLRILQYALEGE